MTRIDRPHHHGNLRAALITAAEQLLAEGGIPALTLRKAAARAGVSHAAPAHHFDGLAGLLTAVATQAFDRFSATMLAARDAAAPNPTARLQGICIGYLQFADAAPGLFHLMFVAPEVDHSDAQYRQAAAAAYAVLREGCAPFSTAAEAEELEIAVWSLVHGFASLQFSKRNVSKRPFSQVPDFSRLLARLLPDEKSR